MKPYHHITSWRTLPAARISGMPGALTWLISRASWISLTATLTSLALLAPGAKAQIDDMQLRLLTGFELPLRWDNVEPRRPYWEYGVVPEWLPMHRLHVVRLAAGQSTTLRLPAGETLRLHSLLDNLPPGALTIALSNGSGLYVQQSPRISENGRDLLVEAAGGTTQLARITYLPHIPNIPNIPDLPYTANGASAERVEVALFVSRREPLGAIAPYREVQPLPGPPVELRRAIDAAGLPYWPLNPFQLTEFTVQGPARYALRSRLRFSNADAALAQGWRIETRLDGQPGKVLEFESAAENAYALWQDGRAVMLSREKEDYIEIPPGLHRLALGTSGPLLVRLLRQEEPDYLFPGLNEPALTPRAVRPVLEEQSPALSSASNSAAAAVIVQQATSPSVVHAAALRLIKDNRQREGGLLASAGSQRAANLRRDMPPLLTQAQETFGLHTFYRDLLPSIMSSKMPSNMPNQAQQGQLQFAWYLTPGLNGIGEDSRGIVVASQHESQLLASMASGYFLPLAELTTDSVPVRHVYDLPQRYAPSLLRIAIHRESLETPGQLTLQFDGQAPIILDAVNFPELPVTRYKTSISEAALRLQQERHGEFGIGTISAAFAQRHVSAPLVPVSFIDVPLPLDVRQVRLWGKSGVAESVQKGETKPLWVALKLRTAKPYQLSERAYLDAQQYLAQQGSVDESGALSAFMAALANPPQATGMQDQAEAGRNEVDSHWQPLVRVLRAQAAGFSASVTPAVASAKRPLLPSDKSASASASASAASASAAVADATRFAERGQWLVALETWSKAANSLRPKERELAFWGRVTALRQLGEAALAEQLLKQEMLQASEQTARIRARIALTEMQTQANDLVALQATYAAALLRDPAVDTENVISGLSKAMIDNGEADLALNVGLLLPRRQRPVETLLRAAYALEWWQVFNDLLAQLATPQQQPQQQYWRALRELTNGQFDQAGISLQQAGSTGQALLVHMESGRKIHAALTSLADGSSLRNGFAVSKPAGDKLVDTLADKLVETLGKWAQWQYDHPGPRTCQDSAYLVNDFAGSQSLYSIDRDKYFDTFRSEPGRPLRLGLVGPVKLRIQARPIHPTRLPDDTTRIEGWLQIRAGERHWQTPITQNAVSTGIVMVGQPKQMAGKSIVQELQFGPGWHEVEIRGSEINGTELPLLLDAQTEQPETRLPLLPPLLPALLQLRLSSPSSTPDTTVATVPGVHVTAAPVWRPLLGGCPDCSVLLGTPDTSATSDKPDTSGIPSLSARHVRIARNLLENNPTRLQQPDLSMLPSLLPKAADAPNDEARLRATKQWSALLTWPTDRSDLALNERMISLLWISEQQPDQYLAAMSLAEAILSAHPTVPGLAAIVARMARNIAWTPVSIVRASAGLRSREISGWEPEAPVLRVRRALLEPSDVNERVISGGNRLVVSFTNTKATSITLGLTSSDVAAQLPQSMTVMLQIDQREPQAIVLEPDQNRDERKLALPSNQHSLRIWIAKPLVNQFLRIRINEAGRPQFAKTVERLYHVATVQEPVRVTVHGPTWVRIDERTAGNDESHYRHIASEREELVLTPAPGQSEALYRIHLRTVATGQSVPLPRLIPLEPTPVPTPVLLHQSAAVNPVSLKDGLRLGGQEDGTWSAELTSNERLYGRDSSPPPPGIENAQIPIERFLELAATYRYFDEERHTHFRGRALVRERQRGGNTLGLEGLASISPSWTPWSLSLNGEVFLQDPANQGSPDWSVNLGASATQRRNFSPKLWHQPRIALFLRHSNLSESNLNNSPFYRTGQLDQDIFTPFRANHRRGIEVGDILTWRPWQDTELFAGATLVSRESLNPFAPDKLGAKAGLRQLLGPAWLMAELNGNHFFAGGQRPKSVNNSTLKIELGGEYWLRNQQRIEIGLNYRREIDARNNLLGFTFIWHFGNGRGYRDFRASEIDFLDVRQRRVPQEQNNEMGQ